MSTWGYQNRLGDSRLKVALLTSTDETLRTVARQMFFSGVVGYTATLSETVTASESLVPVLGSLVSLSESAGPTTPIIVDRISASGFTRAAPSGTSVGDLVVVLTWERNGSSTVPVFTVQSGYTEILQQSYGPDGGAAGAFGLAYIVATVAGAQNYTAYASSLGGTARTTILVYQAGTYDTTGILSAVTFDNSDTNEPDPPNVSGLNPAKIYSITAIGAWHVPSANVIPGAPTGYSNLLESATSAVNIELATADKTVTGVSSEDPGPFTDNQPTINGTVSATLAIPGPGTAGLYISEAISVSQGFPVPLAETVTASESLTTLLTRLLGLSETITLSEALVLLAGPTAALSETVNLSETLSGIGSVFALLSETVTGPSEALASTQGALLALSETATLTEAIAAAASNDAHGITNRDQLIAAMATRQDVSMLCATSGNPGVGTTQTTLSFLGVPGGTSATISFTSSGRTPTSGTAPFPAINTFTTGNIGYIDRIQWSNSVASLVTLYDRVFECGTYAFNAAQTLSGQPSYASRIPDANYSGLQIWVEAATSMNGGGVPTWTIGYTNETGTTGRTITFTAPLATTVRMMWQIPLQTGDKGVQKIESVTCTDASNGLFNVLVLRPLWRGIARAANDGDIHTFDRLGMPRIYDTSALFMNVYSNTGSAGLAELQVGIING